MSKKQYYCADFETTTISISSTNTRVWLYYIENVFTSEDQELGLNIKDFFKFINNLKNNSDIYFHNLNFDGEFILHHLVDNYVYVKGEVGKFNVKLLLGEWTSMSDGVSSHYKIRFKNLNGASINFLCSYKHLLASVSSLMGDRALEGEKEVIDYDTIYTSISDIPQIVRKYIYNDVRTIIPYMKEMIEKIGKNMGITSSGTAMKMVKTHLTRETYDRYFKNNIKMGHFNKLGNYVDGEWDYYKKYYLGGWTYLHKDRELKLWNNIKVIDINSLYPYIMRNFDLPIGSAITCKSKKCTHMKLLEVNLDFKIKENGIPFIPSSTGYVTHIEWLNEGRIHLGYFTQEMLEEIYNQYDVSRIKIIKETHFVRGKDIFTDYIDFYQEMKQNATKGSFEYSFSKLMQNQVYGKFGMSPLRKKYYFRDFDPLKDMRLDKVVYGAKKKKVMDYDYDLTEPAYLPMAIWITSLAKIETIKVANLINKMTCQNDICRGYLYGDTDSVHASICDSCWEKIKPLIDLHPKRLGAWDLEKEVKHGWYIKRKMYFEFDNIYDNITIDSFGSAGITKKDLTQYTFKDIIENNFEATKLYKRKVEGGIILDKRKVNITCVKEK